VRQASYPSGGRLAGVERLRRTRAIFEDLATFFSARERADACRRLVGRAAAGVAGASRGGTARAARQRGRLALRVMRDLGKRWGYRGQRRQPKRPKAWRWLVLPAGDAWEQYGRGTSPGCNARRYADAVAAALLAAGCHGIFSCFIREHSS
jgi:hypothetical protein